MSQAFTMEEAEGAVEGNVQQGEALKAVIYNNDVYHYSKLPEFNIHQSCSTHHSVLNAENIKRINNSTVYPNTQMDSSKKIITH